jgi:hypothetical protein
MARRNTKVDLRNSAAHLVKFENGVFTATIDIVTFSCPQLARFNEMLDRLGYKSVRLTQNLMSRRTVIIDADTPRSCDVGSETYWSM